MGQNHGFPARRDGSGDLHPGSRAKRFLTSTAVIALAVMAGFSAHTPASAQQNAIIQPGFMAVTGFPGTLIPGFEEGLLPGVDPVDETFIDTERASLRIFDMTWLGAPPSGQVVFTPPPFEVPASEIGQVFG
ncbi:MAG: hypothetical protein RLO21_13135, partial [Nitratireductor sp.]